MAVVVFKWLAESALGSIPAPFKSIYKEDMPL